MLQILRYSRVYETNNVIGNLEIINNRFKIYGIAKVSTMPLQLFALLQVGQIIIMN